ncbi:MULTISPECIES: 6-phospho-3-hexuloisomerase [Methanothermobacter]|uniref:Predicted 3-hexulose-6-phosphate isomerase n=1 Tax=Methanothermobacter marburgensis (strain ATCC BAA-927 / DSM 2133 / JCM 14651 / NBRC 100331 / OCM 82 / Marburg) TaxID=79929 RepID=D9PU43_METTM|nr:MULTISPECIES: 6-phospho-3-hexuloisomerase [Methanothermobacter]ADL57741.1 predicted 3-hexulose-6-phosphate isomerase [Methanothermobacter marburgensis str. Marburg]QEF94374.1 6-phospho-3-hexuloisomerase [Methanothermobacter sp. KEPCO-1]QHN08213.1 6-phospho-3-hexuloisomerase [Methanothermobacter sp. THM-2]WBF09960.1 6-phospho-3-hexuloisomerase [Methanothermobacter marburgensis]
MIMREAIRDIVDNLEKMEREIDAETVDRFIDTLTSAGNVFVLGLGRSGLVAKAFAMRLMHLEINVFVVGETITPAINEGDALIAISGSGRTSYIVSAARIARERGAQVVAVTSHPESELGGIADLTVTVRGRTKIDGEKNYMKRQIRGNHHSRTPLGTLFEISALVFLDGLIAELMHRLDKREEDLNERHSVFE